MDVTIRDVEEADLPAVADLWRRTHPHLVMMTAAGIAHRLRTTPPHAHRVYRVAVDADGRVVGTTRALLGTETASAATSRCRCPTRPPRRTWTGR